MEELKQEDLLRKNLKSLTKKKESLETKIEELNEQYSKICSEIDEANNRLEIYDYYQSVINILSNSKYYENHYLFSDTPTRDIMSRLREGSCQKTLHRREGDKKSIKLDYYLIDNRYVVLFMPKYSVQNICEYELTATEYKKGYRFSKAKENLNSDLQVRLQNGYLIQLYNHPVHLKAQTKYDMEYGKIWEGDYCVFEGNNYGDTSSFLIVGERIYSEGN